MWARTPDFEGDHPAGRLADPVDRLAGVVAGVIGGRAADGQAAVRPLVELRPVDDDELSVADPADAGAGRSSGGTLEDGVVTGADAHRSRALLQAHSHCGTRQ